MELKLNTFHLLFIADSSTPNTTIANTQTEEVIQLNQKKRKTCLMNGKNTTRCTNTRSSRKKLG